MCISSGSMDRGIFLKFQILLEMCGEDEGTMTTRENTEQFRTKDIHMPSYTYRFYSIDLPAQITTVIFSYIT